jgi:anaerobic ribonucleoside-triphosphate reductase activating protein
LSTTGGHLVTAEELTRALLRKAADYREAEGVTVLGGEPFEQAAALAVALAPVRAAGLSVMCYSGHLLEGLQASSDPGPHALLALCDLLVDGPFREELYDPALLWRGSRNQRILRLSDRYSEADLEAAMARQGRSLWISHSPQGDVVASGAQSREIVSRQRRTVTVVQEKRR